MAVKKTDPVAIQTNDLELTDAERAAVDRVATRLSAEVVSLYRASTGLRAYVRDTAGGEHLGVSIS